MRRIRTIAALLAGMVTTGVVGCAPTVSSQSGAPPPGPTAPPPSRQGMSTKNKVILLAGAAALYYLYKKHQNAQGAGVQGQYYRSKNGGIYYRDPKNPKIVHWVTPPPGGLQVPASEAQQYSRYAGYNGRATGAQFGGYGAAPAGAGSPSGAGGPGGAGGPPGPPGPGR